MTSHHGPVALFTGATAGIGEAILKAYAKQHPNARIYFVGRKEASARRIVEEVREIWAGAQEGSEDEGLITFLKADLTLLRNVHAVVDEIKRREGDGGSLDLLCMSQGYLTLKGRQETSEGHDALLVLGFYSRAYLAYHLLPFLRSSTSPNGARVISILAPGHEGPFYFNDLGLKERHAGLMDWLFPGWTRRLTGLDPGYVRVRVSHSVIMTTLFFEELAKRERESLEEAQPTIKATPEMFGDNEDKAGVSFLHIYPGLVKTKEFEMGDFPAMLKAFFTKIMLPLITPLTVAVEKVGERVASMADDKRFRLSEPTRDDEAMAMELGSDKLRGSGSYCLRWNGRRTVNDNILDALRKKGASELVWKHCMDVFEGMDAMTVE